MNLQNIQTQYRVVEISKDHQFPLPHYQPGSNNMVVFQVTKMRMTLERFEMSKLIPLKEKVTQYHYAMDVSETCVFSTVVLELVIFHFIWLYFI